VGATGLLAEAHADSIIRVDEGRVVPVKVHRCLWSGAYPENSLPAIAECYREAVARAEIDLHPLRDADFLVIHDAKLDRCTTGTGSVGALTRREVQSLRLRVPGGVSSERPPLLSEVVALIQSHPAPTMLELDLVTTRPMPFPRVEELARLLEPVKDRVFVNGYDWNLRRMVGVDPALGAAYDLLPHLDWVPEGEEEPGGWGLPRGVYGYLDAHPLARERTQSTADYLADRLGVLARLVPGAHELHMRLALFERMRIDGVPVAALIHQQGLRLDVWTLNAGMPRWQERMAGTLAAGADVITSDTPRVLASWARNGGVDPDEDRRGSRSG
jgi:glycerophosphoryl diester phosphodiesterase